eukprot:SAG22_NODE_845_length_6871_cov_3.172327_2_plen_549_part_00
MAAGLGAGASRRGRSLSPAAPPNAPRPRLGISAIPSAIAGAALSLVLLGALAPESEPARRPVLTSLLGLVIVLGVLGPPLCERLGLGLVVPFVRVQLALSGIHADRTFSMAKLFRLQLRQRQAQGQQGQPMVLSCGRAWSWADVDSASDAVAAYARKLLGSERSAGGATIAVMMHNSAGLVVVMLGLAKAGGVTAAMLNPALRGKSLRHCLSVSQAVAVFAGPDVLAVGGVLGDLAGAAIRQGGGGSPRGWNVFSCSDNCGLPEHGSEDRDNAMSGEYLGVRSLHAELRRTAPSEGELAAAAAATAVEHPPAALAYVFTSGTTGLPKACKISHAREASGGYYFSLINRITCADRLYSPIGLYHSAGSLALAICLVTGCSLVLPKKFSASGTIPDCRDSAATVLVYIGEMLRYILNVEPTPRDKEHSLRMAQGNGLRPGVWGRFVGRFDIPNGGVREYYSSTEGTVTLVNCRGRQHSVGYLPPWAKWFYRVPVVRVVQGGDAAAGAGGSSTPVPVRDPATGLCVECAAGEQGELLGPIDSSDPAAQFDG